MRFDLWTCAIAAAFLGLATIAASAQPVHGSFERTCRNIRIAGPALTADCRDASGHFRTSSVAYDQCRGDIANNNGLLFCDIANRGRRVTGSFEQSCRNIQTSGGILSAECADASGRIRRSSLNLDRCRGDIANADGRLICNDGFSGNGDRRNGGDR
jgi:hypothetical protein